ncbi:hypothetical protein CPB83DRAFT_845767 [Crepidotus variabilis]|uniref:Heme oxygenase n=1 Tax=Crepidotus variabilis TaxID=179855 RepID=A0A9P6EPL9_9AGAR|nr:hypothetical protein CPB83DRAFT_845767 [Crepidotus variabilis]
MAVVDDSKPLATLLRESTKAVHEQVENSSGASRLLSGQVSKEEYAQYLMMLWHVYSALEDALDRHSNHPSLEPTFNPTLLARAPALSVDISYLLQSNEWRTHPLHLQLISSNSLYKRYFTPYVDRIVALSNSSDPSPLLAHSYVRYLGDLSGGQFIRHTIAKAYGLDESTGEGLSFYAFKELRSSNSASLGEMKRIKEWFREGINAAGDKDKRVKGPISEEASHAFLLNASLFEAFDEPTKEELEIDLEEQVEQPIALKDRSYPMSQVIALIAAVCLAHFLLVAGGFTGSAGYQKWLSIEEWMQSWST